MESGGDLLLNDFGCLLRSVGTRDPGIDQRQQLRRIQAPDALLGDLEQFPDQGRGGLHSFEPLACRGPKPDRRKRRLDHVGGAQMAPVLLRKLINGDEPFPIML